MIQDVDDMSQGLGQKFVLAPVPHEIIARTYANFARRDVGSFSSKFYDVFLQRRNSPDIATIQSKTHAGALGMAERVSLSRKYCKFIVVDPIVTLGSPGQVVIFREPAPAEPKIEISPAAQERLCGHALLAEKVYSIIKEEAKRADVSPRIVVRPSWSHEYEDQTGVVIEVEIAASDEKRFNLWDTISLRLDALLDSTSLSEEEQSFLTNKLSVIVTQSR